MSGPDCLVIFTTDKTPWFNSGANGTALAINPVGKGKGPKKAPSKSRASAKSGPEVVNPYFTEMAAVCIDPFWKTTFTEASYGKFHRGFKYEKESATLIFKIRNKSFTCNIYDLAIPDAVAAVQNFMRTTANIMSSADIQERTQRLNQMRALNVEAPINSWGKIKSNQHRQILISKFVVSVTEACKLTVEEANQLDRTIRLGVIIKYFDSSNIHMNNGLIVSIDGLRREENGLF